MIIVGIPAGLAVFAGFYFLTRFWLGSPPLDPGLPEEIFVVMTVLSVVVGVVLFLGLNAIWERKYGGRPLALATMLFGLVTSLATQFLVSSDRIAIGVSWIVTITTAVSFGLLFFPEVIRYFGSRS